MQLTLNVLRSLIREQLMAEYERRDSVDSTINEATKPLRFFHGSTHDIKVGQVLKGGGDQEKTSEFPPQLEKFFDDHRPKSMAGRLNGVFVVTRPGDVNWAGGATDFVYEVEPIGSVLRHSQHWFTEAYSLFLREGTGWPPRLTKSDIKRLTPELEQLTTAYWSGTPPPRTSRQAWEWLTPRAKVIRKVRFYR